MLLPMAGANNRATFGHTVSDGVGKAYLFEEGFYLGIKRSTTDNDFIEGPTEDFHSSLPRQRFDFIVYNGHFKQ